MQTQPQVTTDKNDYQYQPEFRHGLELLEQQKYQEAYALFVELAKQNPDNGYAQYELAILCQMNEQYGLALQSVTLAIQNLQNNSVWLAAAYVQRSRIYGALGNTEQQLQDLNKSILILPNAGNMYANRGDFYHTQKQYDLSEADYCKQAELEPGNAYPHAALGIIAIEKENYQEAEMHLSYALKLDPNYYQAYTLMGDCHLAGRNYVKAIECYTKTLAIRHGEERAEDALINRMPREFDTQIIASLETLSREQSNNGYWPQLLGHLHFFHGRYEESISQYEESFRRCGKPVELGNMSRAYYELHDYYKARYYAEKSIDMDPTDDNPHCVLTNSLMEMEQFEEAGHVLRRYLNIMPQNATAHQMLADAYRFISELDKALEEANTAISLASENPTNLYTRAKIKHDLGDLDGERCDLEAALRLLPTAVSQFISLRCQIFQMLNRIDEADEELAKPHDETWPYYLNLSVNRALQGKEEEATEALKHALDLGLIRFDMLRTNPLMEPLRQLPQFDALINDSECEYHANLAQEALNPENGESESDEVPITREGDGLICVRGEINGLPLKLVFDTGASDISLSSVEAAFMLKNGYLEERDLGGVCNYRTASGELVEGTIVNLREVKLGKVVFRDLRATIIKNQEAPLLLGQSMMARLMKYQIDNDKKTLYFMTYSRPVFPFDLYCLALASVDAHNYKKAAICYKMLFEMMENYSSGFNAAYLYLLAGELDDALSMLDLLQTFLDQHPDQDSKDMRVQICILRGYALQCAHRFEEACDAYTLLEEQQPNEAIYPYSHGWTLRRMDRLAEAEQILLHAEAVDPQGIGQKLDLGYVYRALGREEEAQRIWSLAADLSPNATSIMAQAEALLRLGRTEECISRVNEGVSMAKSESETLQQAVMYLDAATLSAELKDYDIAHEYLRTSLSYSIAPYHSICGLSEYEILKQIPDFDKIVAEYL